MPSAPPEPALSASTWAPLRSGPFRAIWFSDVASNIGGWMQTVGAQWLLVSVPHAPIFVSLVLVTDMVPDLLFGMVGGVLADTYDRRRLLIIVQIGLAITCGALTVLTYLHRMPPELLLAFTLMLGFGSVPVNPAFQAITPELVPREQVPAAAVLSGVSINLARAIGPALAGIMIARTGVASVFAVNTATFILFAVVIAAWRPKTEATPRAPEQFGSALRAGGRYIRYAPVVRRIFLRAALFLVPGSAMWALLPLVASERLGKGPGFYGVMLAALGAGAVGGAFILPRLRARLSPNQMVVATSAVFAAALAAVVLARNEYVTLAVLLPAGVAWIAVLSWFNAEVQLFLPAWVRARGLSVYQMVFFGSQALGALLWGAVANSAGLAPTFLAAAALMALGAGTIRIWPLFDTKAMDRSRVVYWEEPRLPAEADADGGPVVVSTTYTIAAEHEDAFLRAMERVRLSRLRTGATQWGLFRDVEHLHRFVEIFTVATWDEHQRQHAERQTGTDREFVEEANALSHPPPHAEHYIGTPTRS
jgi:predicted MFS family arabinose efflux permease